MKFALNVSRGTFNKVFLPYLEYYKKRYQIFYGGAGAGKSVFIVTKLLWKILFFKGTNVLVVRKVAKDNRVSTFNEFKKAISAWQLDRPKQKVFSVNKSDYTITCINGNQIVFAGLDDASKLKGIVFPNGILTDIWMEEADQMTADDFQLLDLRLRGKCDVPFNIHISFNPVSALSWLKSTFFDVERDDCLILKTTYKDNQWCDEAYKVKIEGLKKTNPVLYKIYGLGEWGVLGELIYTNWTVRHFTWCVEELTNKDEQKKYDYIFKREELFNGQDWGFNDPSATAIVGYKDDELYFLQEVYAKGLDNPELMVAVEKDTIAKPFPLCADSSEPARIKEWRKNKWLIRGAIKKKDFKINGIRWIHSKRINIHPSCVNAKSEFEGYVYEKDKDGKVLEVPVDFNDHLMDSMLYGLERAIRGRSVEFLK